MLLPGEEGHEPGADHARTRLDRHQEADADGREVERPLADDRGQGHVGKGEEIEDDRDQHRAQEKPVAPHPAQALEKGADAAEAAGVPLPPRPRHARDENERCGIEEEPADEHAAHGRASRS